MCCAAPQAREAPARSTARCQAVGPAGSHRSVRRTLATRRPPGGGLWYPGAVPDARLAVRLEHFAATVLRRGAFRASCAAAPHRPPARDKPVLPVTRARQHAPLPGSNQPARLEGSTRGKFSSTHWYAIFGRYDVGTVLRFYTYKFFLHGYYRSIIMCARERPCRVCPPLPVPPPRAPDPRDARARAPRPPQPHTLSARENREQLNLFMYYSQLYQKKSTTTGRWGGKEPHSRVS